MMENDSSAEYAEKIRSSLELAEEQDDESRLRLLEDLHKELEERLEGQISHEDTRPGA